MCCCITVTAAILALWLYQAAAVTSPAEKWPTPRSSLVLPNPAALSTSEMTKFPIFCGYDPILCFYIAFLSVPLFPLCDVGNDGANCGIGLFLLCCLSAFVRSTSLSLNLSDQVGASTAAHARAWLTRLRHSPWLWLAALIRERWILANQITATGWSHKQWIFTQLICILFYCQIMMTILANITKNAKNRLQL